MARFPVCKNEKISNILAEMLTNILILKPEAYYSYKLQKANLDILQLYLYINFHFIRIQAFPPGPEWHDYTQVLQ